MLAPSQFDEDVFAADNGNVSFGLVALACLLAALIFSADMLLPLGVASGVPYAGVVLIGLWSRWRPLIFVLAGLGTALTLLGYFYSPVGSELWIVGVNRGLAILIICVTAIVAWQRNRWEDKLRQSEAQMRLVTNALPVLISYVDSDRRFRFVNETAENWFAKPRANIIGRSITEVVGEAQAARSEPVLKRIDHGESIEQEFTETYPDGITRIVKMSVVPDFGVGSIVRGHFALFQDVTKRKHVETARRGQSQIRLLADNLPVMIFSLDPELRFRFANKAYCEANNWEQAEIVGKDLREVLSKPAYKTLKPNIDAVLMGHQDAFETRYTFGDNVERDIEASYVPEIDDRGKVCGFFVSLIDVTEHKQSEEALKESEETLSAFFSNAPVGMALYDRDIRYLKVNKELAWDSDLSVDDHVGKSIAEIKPELAKVLEPIYREMFESGEARLLPEAQGEMPSDPGVKHWWWGFAFPTSWTNGKPSKIGVVALDITERKRIEAEVRATAENLDAILKASPLAILTADLNGNILNWNPASEATFGWREDEVLGKFNPLIPENERELFLQFEKETASGKPVRGREFRRLHKNGTLIDIAVWTAPLRDASDKIVGIMGVLEDITERKRIEDEIRKLNADLEQRVEKRTVELRNAQSELVRKERLATLGQLSATVSHELRNPLGTIRNSLVVLEKNLGGSNPGVQRSLERIARNIGRCNNIIDEMLDFARARELELKKTAFDDWLGRVLDELQVPPGVSVGRKFGAPKVRIGIDDDRLRRAIVNVYDNAGQAMLEEHEGKVPANKKKITVSTKATKGRLEVAIADSGPGMPPEVLNAAFEPLYSTKGFGVGLGLPIVKQVMEQHGGGIEITSKQASGTRVILWLPLEQSTTKTKRGAK